MKIIPREKARRGAWSDFHSRLRFARSIIPEENGDYSWSTYVSATLSRFFQGIEINASSNGIECLMNSASLTNKSNLFLITFFHQSKGVLT